ncbi:uncharacterized protein L203_103238 [Cryptococcus depauperatus CBS 7841]|uniref:Uncharacterized protein n=1 Tax=Cryptococcus depauperatus CBS 7841 TaxID=1295531 RepID=A0A1E3HPH1_9TREE|nr:hypothetical protein L203_06146 [Cryptococcus depauperatus CBS 7841]
MGRRLEDASCAICIDSLFTKRDDLDDIVPIATCECGHVFHEPCLREWFRTQSEAYIAAARSTGIPGRHGSPTLSDAPVECPSCRAECFANPETGEPLIHRLFITFDGSSSSVGLSSSPITSTFNRKGKRKEQEIFGLARRAKGLAEEVKDLNASSTDEDVQRMLNRADTLAEDLEMSAKASSGIKTYAEGLTAAINKLRASLESHPLIANLQARIFELEEIIKEHNNSMRVIIPSEVRKAKEAEQAKLGKKVKQIRDELEAIQRELEREKVARRASKKEMDVRAKENEKIIADLKRQIELEVKEREDLQSALQERGKLLKMYHTKNESRKELKTRLKVLESENAHLKDALKAAFAPHDTDSFRGQHPSSHVPDQSSDFEGDFSIEEIPACSVPQKKSLNPPYHISSKYEDESLLIEIPSSQDDSLRQASPKRKEPECRHHPTARTISFDLEEGLKRRKPNKSKYFAALDNQEKNKASCGQEMKLGSFNSSDEGNRKLASRGEHLSYMNTKNPFVRQRNVLTDRKFARPPLQWKTCVSPDVLVPDSSPPMSPRRNQHILVTSSPSPEHTEPSSVRKPLEETHLTSAGITNQTSLSTLKRKDSGKDKAGQNIIDFLGMRDANGRPKTGVRLVTGRQIHKRL